MISSVKNNDEIQDKMRDLDFVTLGHSERVCEIAAGIEEYYNHPDNWLSEAAYVHDIGKIWVPRSILDKRGPLSVDERDIIDRHAYLSYRILCRAGVEEEVARICLYHHGLNKPGYRKVPMWEGDKRVFEYANMLQTIDMYEAITSERPYHHRRDSYDAIQIIEKFEGEKNRKVINYLSNPQNARLYI